MRRQPPPETDARHQFAREFPRCWLCDGTAHDVHEIARGVHRKRAVQERCAWLRACRLCHDKLGDYAIWPLERQYALKMIYDPDNYDRIRVNEIRGRDANAISETDVAIQVAMLWRILR